MAAQAAYLCDGMHPDFSRCSCCPPRRTAFLTGLDRLHGGMMRLRAAEPGGIRYASGEEPGSIDPFLSCTDNTVPPDNCPGSVEQDLESGGGCFLCVLWTGAMPGSSFTRVPLESAPDIRRDPGPRDVYSPNGSGMRRFQVARPADATAMRCCAKGVSAINRDVGILGGKYPQCGPDASSLSAGCDPADTPVTHGT